MILRAASGSGGSKKRDGGDLEGDEGGQWVGSFGQVDDWFIWLLDGLDVKPINQSAVAFGCDSL